MMKIVHTITRDSPDGQPWPPSDGSVLWVIVRRVEGYTRWRAIQLAQERPSGDASHQEISALQRGDPATSVVRTPPTPIIRR
jgi:hypothetical protein